MPKSKHKRTTGRVATRRAPIWLSSREYKKLLAAHYLLAEQLQQVKQFIAALVKASSEAGQPPADTGTPGIEYSIVEDRTMFNSSQYEGKLNIKDRNAPAI